MKPQLIRILLLILPIGGLCVPAASALAGHDPQPVPLMEFAQGPDGKRADRTISPKQAANRAQRKHGGRVLSVKLKNGSADAPTITSN